MTNAETIKAIIDAAGGTLVNVRFTKKNGEERSLTFNPRDFAEVKGTGTKCADENIRTILDEAKSGFVSIQFTKANGEQRQLTTNPKHIGEVLGTGTPTKDPAVFRIMDAKLNQWRSFRAERVISIKANGTTTQFTQEA